MDDSNVKLSNSQFDKIKSGIINCTKVTLNLSSNIITFVKGFKVTSAQILFMILFLLSCES